MVDALAAGKSGSGQCRFDNAFRPYTPKSPEVESASDIGSSSAIGISGRALPTYVDKPALKMPGCGLLSSIDVEVCGFGGFLHTSTKNGPKSRQECELATGQIRAGRCIRCRQANSPSPIGRDHRVRSESLSYHFDCAWRVNSGDHVNQIGSGPGGPPSRPTDTLLLQRQAALPENGQSIHRIFVFTEIPACFCDMASHNVYIMSHGNPRKHVPLRVPKPNLPPRKSERTREAILDSALEFLWTRPFRDLTVGELMAGAGSSRPAFYRYFRDLHELMETLLLGLKEEILKATTPWFQGEGDPFPLLAESFQGLVQVCYQRGPILRAVTDAAPNDERLEKSWRQFLKEFDDAVTARIEQQQEAGWVPEFDAYTTAVALNRMDVALVIHAFGRRPRAQSRPVLDAMLRIWNSTLYPTQKSVELPLDGRRR